MHIIKILDYQGNKTSLMPFISKNIYKYVSSGSMICDIFSGSGSVGAFLKNDYHIVANDAELYSYIISSALLNTPPTTKLLNVKDLFLKKIKSNFNTILLRYKDMVYSERKFLSTKDTKNLVNLYKSFHTIWNSNVINYKTLKDKNEYNLFLYYYSGTYFGIEQSISIDAIVKTIHEVSSEYTKHVLFSCLFYAMKETVFSKDGHMAQPLNIEKNSVRHLKQRNKNILIYFVNKLDEFIKHSSEKSEYNNHKFFNSDIYDLLNNEDFKKQPIKLIYADPPYTDMQYSRYYHLLNIVARYDYPKPTILRGKFTTGLYTEGRNQSDLSKKRTAKTRLQELFNYCKKNNIVLALSYAYPKDKISQKTDRYTVSIEELVNMAKEIFGNKKVQIEQENYHHTNHRNNVTKEVLEYLILCGQENHKSDYDLITLKKEIKKLTPTSKNSIYSTHLYWSQKSYSVIDLLINYLSSEGDVVFDPFMGSGVTIIESVKNGTNRTGVGCDVNEMSKFIVENILHNIPHANLRLLFHDLEEKLTSLSHYYETKCTKCYEVGIITKVVFNKLDRTKNNFKIQAISYNCPNCGKRVKEANEVDYIKFSTIACDKFVPNQKLIQNSKIAVGVSDKISYIFTPRNFSVLNELVGYINTSPQKNILNYLLMSILHLAKITDMHSNSQWPLWIPKINCVEKNIIELLKKRMKNLNKAQNFVQINYSNTKIISSFNELTTNDIMVLTKGSQHITNDDIPDDSVSLIITDPPYMDQVLYSEYMQLYQPFIGINFNLDDEIIVSSAPTRKRNKEEYFTLLFDVFKICSKKLKENHIMCLFFHDSNLDIWVRLMDILETNGFRFISQEHVKKSKTVKNILSPKKSLSGDAILFFENTRTIIPKMTISISTDEIKYSVYLEARKLLEKYGNLSTPELYDLGIMEMLIENGWLNKLSITYKSLVEIFEEYFIWKRDSAKWHLQV